MSGLCAKTQMLLSGKAWIATAHLYRIVRRQNPGHGTLKSAPVFRKLRKTNT